MASISGKPFTLFALGMAYERFRKKRDLVSRERCYSLLRKMCLDEQGKRCFRMTANEAEFILQMENAAIEIMQNPL